MQPIQTISWTVSMARAALRDFEHGYFQRAASLADAMTRDDRISAVLRSRTRALLGLPRTITPGVDNRAGKKIAAALELDYGDMINAGSLQGLLRWAVLLGVSIAENVWELSDREDGAKRWIPRLKVWHPQFLSFRWDTQTYWLATTQGPIEVIPGDGRWVMLKQSSERPWMEGLVRELAIPYLIRQFAMRDWARYSEVHGLPTKIAKVPSQAAEDDKKKFFTSIRNLGAEAIVKMITPPVNEAGYELSLLEAKANSWAGFDGLIKQMDSSIAISVLGQNLTTEVKGGSRSAAEVQERTKLDVIEADANLFLETLEKQTIKHWLEINYGTGIPVPEMMLDTSPPKDVKLRADTLNVVSDLLPKLKAAGVNTDAILGEFNLELSTEPSPLPEPQLSSKFDFLFSDKNLALARTADGFTNGQLYADELADQLLQNQPLESDTLSIMRLIESAEDFDALRTGLLEVYQNMDSGDFRTLLEKASILAGFAGRHAVREDTS